MDYRDKTIVFWNFIIQKYNDNKIIQYYNNYIQKDFHLTKKKKKKFIFINESNNIGKEIMDIEEKLKQFIKSIYIYFFFF